ncbi:MAG: hypothetical protein MUE56_07590 [Ignavibacteria bacterium]|jgi:hypothetical protein|nr:hypothetical protein [Ignavibacteria bacterium]
MTETLIIIGSIVFSIALIFAVLFFSGIVPKKKLHEIIFTGNSDFDFRFFVHTSRMYRIFFRYKVEYNYDTSLSTNDENCFGVTVDAALIIPGKADIPVKRGFGVLIPEDVPRYSGTSFFNGFTNSGSTCSKSGSVVLCIIKKARIGEIAFRGKVVQSENVIKGKYKLYIC